MDNILKKELENTQTIASLDEKQDKYSSLLQEFREVNNIIAEIELNHKQKIEIMEKELEDQTKPLKNTLKTLEDKIKKSFEDDIGEDSEVSYLDTEYGRIGRRKQQPKFKRDDKKLIKWLEENKRKEFIKIEKKPEWGKFKKETIINNGKLITKEGEEVDGVVVEERPDKIYIDLE